MAQPGDLEKSWVRPHVIRDLAAAKMTKVAIAKKYGVGRQAIHEFERRHVDDIRHVRDNIDDAFAGIVFADKANRVQALTDQARRILEQLDDPDEAARLNVGRAEMERVAQSGLRAIAEELGQLPSRMQVQVGGQLDVQVNGVELGDLK